VDKEAKLGLEVVFKSFITPFLLVQILRQRRKHFSRLALVVRFPRFTPVACFHTFESGYMFSRAWHWLHSYAPDSEWFIVLFATIAPGRKCLKLPYRK